MTGGIIWARESMSMRPGWNMGLADDDRYQRAYVDFFEDELVRHGYDWKKVVANYLFSGKEPLFNSLTSDRMYYPSILPAYTNPDSWPPPYPPCLRL